MGTIRRLDEKVINQIAAGEVVERPASVVKELVENAMDAGATHITVELASGGTTSIAITDNGGGIPADQMNLALERHATSKIQDAEDLFSVASMGFRGEALASIAAVSDFTLRSRIAEQDVGNELRIVDGKAEPLTPWNGAVGTQVLVSDLFASLPVRQSFLKKPSTEYAHCLEFLQCLSLSQPSVGFRLVHNGKETFTSPAVGQDINEDSVRHRLKPILGDVVDRLIWVENRSRFGSVKGLVSVPGQEKHSSKSQYFLVNQRWVRDKLLRFAVQRGYHSHVLKGRYPVVVLYLQMDPGLVDVNVHPAKTELRFQYAEEVQNLLAIAIRQALRQGAWADPPLDADRSQNVPSPKPRTSPAFFASNAALPQRQLQPQPTVGESVRTRSYQPSTLPSSGKVKSKLAIKPAAFGAADLISQPGLADEAPLWSQLNFIGTFAKCYLLFEHQDHLLVVDQHAFHERILFERFSTDPSLMRQTQKLLVPEEVALPASAVAILRDQSQQLHGIGFEYAILGDECLELRGMPTLVCRRDPEEVLAALAAGEARDFATDSVAGIASHLLSTMACHSAVRAGEELTENELKQLLKQASEVDFFHNCPHGRRVFRWWKLSQVAGWFDR